ncbi:AraC family transcriptional regulator [Victivallis sp. Marseille-Q1083]|uniref:helix-turn-helix domain-containing protein n=1 Tax=Victivallis sp. Marseille-Q1083 TaxID=2717288 RepID=UPI00158C7FEA|nr:AraC family transcriptional regulator [Victivallis sp. Marseille-Q1083]
MSILRKFELFNEECVVALENEGDSRLYMPLCGITRCFPDYHIRRTNSCECIIEAIVSGSGLFQIGKMEYHPKAGDVYIAHLGSDHYYRTDPRNPWVKIWFNLRGSLVEELLRSYHLDKVNYLPGCRLEKLFEESLETMRRNLDQPHETATLVAHRLIYHLARCAATTDAPRQPEAEEMKLYLDQRLSGSLSLQELARLIGRSQSQCRRIFSQAYGVSPYHYFLDRKLELAKLMIERDNKSLKEIAAELGFADPYYFSNLFKSRYHISPSSLRKRHGNS